MTDDAHSPDEALQAALRTWLDHHQFPKESHAKPALELVLRDAWTDMVRDRRQAGKQAAAAGQEAAAPSSSPLPEGEGLGVRAADNAPDPDGTDGNASSLTPDS